MRQDELTDDTIDYIVTHMDIDVLSPWETRFYESVCDQWNRNRRLTQDQKFKLGEIWDEQP